MIDIPAVILAGGLGERIKVLTGGRPKSLLYLLGKHIIEYPLRSLVELNFKHVFIVASSPKDFEDIAVKYGKYISIELVQQARPGIEGAITSLEGVIDDDFVLLYGDVIMPTDAYRELLSIHMAGDYGVLLVPEEEVADHVIVKLGGVKSIEMFEEGSKASMLTGCYVVGGAYIMPKDFIEILESHGKLVKALNYVNSRYGLKPCIWSGWWIDIEYPWDLMRASLYLLHSLDKSIISSSAKISNRAVIEGPIVIEDEAEVDHYAVIKGPVYIGKKTYIGDHSLIRGYTTLEGENVIGSYVEIVWSCIQRRVSIGSKSYIGFSVVGENSIIEPGVITLNIVPEEVKISRAIKTERRGREYVKLGAVIGFGARVRTYSILNPGEVVSVTS